MLVLMRTGEFQPGRPERTEYRDAFGGYVQKAAHIDDLVAALEQQRTAFAGLLHRIEPQQRSYRYAPNKWTVQEVLGHIIDCERVFGYRLLAIARGDQTPLPGFDENLYAAQAGADGVDWDDLVAEFDWLRRSHVSMVRRLAPAAWVRIGTVSGHPSSVRAIGYIMLGHLIHHRDVLREKYQVG